MHKPLLHHCSTRPFLRAYGCGADTTRIGGGFYLVRGAIPDDDLHIAVIITIEFMQRMPHRLQLVRHRRCERPRFELYLIGQILVVKAWPRNHVLRIRAVDERKRGQQHHARNATAARRANNGHAFPSIEKGGRHAG